MALLSQNLKYNHWSSLKEVIFEGSNFREFHEFYVISQKSIRENKYPLKYHENYFFEDIVCCRETSIDSNDLVLGSFNNKILPDGFSRFSAMSACAIKFR